MDPYQEVFIKDLNSSQTKVAISGTVISKEDNSLVIDDSTGQMVVLVNELLIPSADYVRIFGRVLPYDQGVQVQADVIQDLSLVDKLAHKKVKEKLQNI